MVDEKLVSIVSLFGYWHLHRRVNGKDYFGHSDHRLGLTIRTELRDSIRDWSGRSPKIEESFTVNGKIIDYIDEPYTESQINSFRNLSIEELEEWVNSSKLY
jgi:hypothetical protein